MTELVTQVAEHRPVGLAELCTAGLSSGIVGLGEVVEVE